MFLMQKRAELMSYDDGFQGSFFYFTLFNNLLHVLFFMLLCLFVVGLKSQEFLGWKSETDLHAQSREMQKKEVDHFRVAGSGFSKQGTYKACLGGSQKRRRFLQPPTRILKVYTETLTGSVIFSPGGLSKRPSDSLTLCPWKQVLLWDGKWWNILSKEKSGASGCTVSSSHFNQQSWPLFDLLQQSCFWNRTRWNGNVTF